MREQELIDREVPYGSTADGVTIWCAFRDRIYSDIARRPWPVLDDERLPELLL